VKSAPRGAGRAWRPTTTLTGAASPLDQDSPGFRSPTYLASLADAGYAERWEEGMGAPVPAPSEHPGERVLAYAEEYMSMAADAIQRLTAWGMEVLSPELAPNAKGILGQGLGLPVPCATHQRGR